MLKRSDDSGDWVSQASALHGRALLAYAGNLLGRRDAARAADVVQETFARLCTRGPGEVRLPEWLFAVARNLAIDSMRKERRMRLADDAGETVESDAPSPLRIVESRDATTAALQLLDRLPARQQEAIRLKFQHELSYLQIAEVMETNVSNVGVLIHTGLKTLRQQMS